MDHVEVELAIHEHPVTPLKDGRRGTCCGIKFGVISDGYHCTRCNLFFHKSCSKAPGEINYASHECNKTLSLMENFSKYDLDYVRCGLCREEIAGDSLYHCRSCRRSFHLDCAKYPPPEVIGVSQNHGHKLELQMWQDYFTCGTCGGYGKGYSYRCHECKLKFHVNCEKYAAEVTHPSHSLHPLKLFTGVPPAYTDGKCSLCGNLLGNYVVFYHCSTCNFSVDLHCILHPPLLCLHDSSTHDHELTLMPKAISFNCNTCGLKGDRSPYVCLPCNFTVHNTCFGFPWVININRHDHRVYRISLLGVVNSVCGICRKIMNWSCGSYSCGKCPDYVYHTKCATREDVWDGLELKDVAEEDEDTQPFKKIDENTIQHYSHKEHNLRLDKSHIFVEDRGSCEACAYPIYHHSFYSCVSCDFILHEDCANLPTRKRHMLSNKRYVLRQFLNNYSKCEACGVCFNGFVYGDRPSGLDMRCASVTEPFFHQSHPDHPLFYTSPQGVCSACKKEASHVLRCVEDKCGYALDFKCALLPYEVKHRVDAHFLSLCFGEHGKKASGKYWCDICEKETDPQAWFYTSKDCELTLHTNCVLGDVRGLKPGRKLITEHRGPQAFLTVRNNSMSRPLCYTCKSHCLFPIILKRFVDTPDGMFIAYHCSIDCCDIGEVEIHFGFLRGPDYYGRSVCIEKS